MTEERVKRKLSAILSADAAGYSRLMGEDEGLLAAQKSIELEPNLAFGYYSLGFLKLQRGDFIEAELAFQTAHELQLKNS